MPSEMHQIKEHNTKKKENLKFDKGKFEKMLNEKNDESSKVNTKRASTR